MAPHAKLDFEDALSVMHAGRQGIDEIHSYDGDFDAIEELERVEP